MTTIDQCYSNKKSNIFNAVHKHFVSSMPSKSVVCSKIHRNVQRLVSKRGLKIGRKTDIQRTAKKNRRMKHTHKKIDNIDDNNNMRAYVHYMD